MQKHPRVIDSTACEKPLTVCCPKILRFHRIHGPAGDESVKNVVDVTILERLSDDHVIWQRFGKEISPAFKRYINEDLLKSNGMMNSVEKLNV